MNSEPAAVVCRPVGLVHCRFTEATGMPIQTAGAPEETGRLEVFAEFAPGLRDIEGFDYLILVTHLHRCAHERLEVVPFLDDASHGVFATRAPARPNRLGLSIVRLVSVEGTTLHFAGNDMMDGTPVLDIKPYVPKFDVRQTERTGWFGARLDQLPRIRSDDRMG
ncbi:MULTISPECIES: tRNA (N6-threonylcarbamoyladenosine(37)-N6)-methyltransferase TrmO [unclassified Variovorax]|uniref:tRNA (N6-threonylcarbamoyladenosine(37)-N6)-methyltransferase TrmO n=1 Tax=unclassified Variovorax TaxID=663243 RepID=UPI003F48B61A